MINYSINLLELNAFSRILGPRVCWENVYKVLNKCYIPSSPFISLYLFWQPKPKMPFCSAMSSTSSCETAVAFQARRDVSVYHFVAGVHKEFPSLWSLHNTSDHEDSWSCSWNTLTVQSWIAELGLQASTISWPRLLLWTFGCYPL